MGPLGFPELALVAALVVAMLLPLWRIAEKMGYPGPVGILAVIPGVNVVLAWYLAFSDWPALRRR